MNVNTCIIGSQLDGNDTILSNSFSNESCQNPLTSSFNDSIASDTDIDTEDEFDPEPVPANFFAVPQTDGSDPVSLQK